VRIRIEAEPGELEDRAEDVVRVVERLCGRELLKADPNEQITQTPAQFEYDVIEDSVKQSRRKAKQIRKVMLAKIAEVLEG
jgi:hypothetical protein